MISWRQDLPDTAEELLTRKVTKDDPLFKKVKLIERSYDTLNKVSASLKALEAQQSG